MTKSTMPSSTPHHDPLVCGIDFADSCFACQSSWIAWLVDGPEGGLFTGIEGKPDHGYGSLFEELQRIGVNELRNWQSKSDGRFKEKVTNWVGILIAVEEKIGEKNLV